MAIQNFVSGGFYGKLGSMVGQRWHNKRTIRTYVIPANPRTEAQQRNRGFFRTAIRLAQEAYNINKGNSEWDTSQMGQFSQMVGLAKRRLQAGMSEADSLPLYPEGYTPPVELTGVVTDWANWPTSLSWSCPGYTMLERREFVILYHIKNEFTGLWEDIEVSTAIPIGFQLADTFLTDGRYSFPSGSSILAATSDDSSHGNQSIFMSAQLITQPYLPSFTFTLSFMPPIPSRPGAEPNIIAQNCAVFTPNTVFIECRFFDTHINSWSTYNPSFQYITGTNTAKITLDTSDSTYPTGSYLIAGSDTTGSATAIVTLQWAQFDFSI